MNIKAVGFYIGHVLRLLAAMMLPPLLIAFFAHEEGTVAAFALSMGITMGRGMHTAPSQAPGLGRGKAGGGLHNRVAELDTHLALRLPAVLFQPVYTALCGLRF